MKKLYKGLIAMAAVAGLVFALSDLDAQTTYAGDWTETNGLTQAMGEYVTQTGPRPNSGGTTFTSMEILIECCDLPVLCWNLPSNADILVVFDANPVTCPPGGGIVYRLTTP